ncbi:hypothetical protein [Streptomyces spongiae]|uniref:Uncharacterized protein n=1 Tax=Streptomyces spongiae TaxID=565072 RepID=A0A5N8XJZ3_9ACTN|nr:hypothetical protein [Streptomyces spongiae]MPY59574.1 hypothetical protein [Streptomyces spongiae]
MAERPSRLPNLEKFKYTLPYASESFGLIQPLLGWRSQRTIARFLEGLRRADDAVLATVSRTVAPQSTYIPPGVSVHAAPVGEAAEGNPPAALGSPETVDLKTGTALANRPYSPVIASTLADLIAEAVKNKNPRDPATWLPLLSRQNLDNLLATKVVPELFKRVDALNPRPSAQDRQTLLEKIGAKESMVAGLLNHLAEQNLIPTLADLFTPPTGNLVKIDQYRGLQQMLDPLEYLSRGEALNRVSLSPVGLVHLFRQYFFEFDTFLGPPVQHIWLSPGGTVELIESHTRREQVERTVEESVELFERRERETTNQDELSTAVKQENEQNTKLGFSVSSNQDWVWGDANETATMDLNTTQRQAREQTHKQMRQQTDRLTTEIKRNFKTTFRTVTETTDSSSRRYVLSNTTQKLVNYELRRKMRRVGVQVQDLGTQLCWQSYVDDPGAALGIAKLVHVAAPPDVTAIAPAPEIPIPEDYTEEVKVTFGYPKDGYIKPPSDGNVDNAWWVCDVELRPRDGYEPASVGEARWLTEVASVDFVLNRTKPIYFPPLPKFLGFPEPKQPPLPRHPSLSVFIMNAHGDKGEAFSFSVPVTYRPTDAKKQEIADANKAKAATRDLELDRKQREAYLKAATERIAAASKIRQRDYTVLREEERVVVYRRLLQQLMTVNGQVPAQALMLHKLAELINSIFDVEAMLYFVAPEWWRPKLHEAHPNFAPELGEMGEVDLPDVLKGRDGRPIEAVRRIVSTSTTSLDDHTSGWASNEDMDRPDNYFITADSEPARMGSSLGWLLQLDGDEQRNAFLNAPWVKAVMPIRPGRELAALNWLSDPSIEGAEGLDDLYQPASAGENPIILKALKAYLWSDPALRQRYQNLDPSQLTIRDVLRYVAITVTAKYAESRKVVTEQLEPGVTLNYLPTDLVYEKGFDPLDKGFQAESDKPYKVFDQWIEVLPTDQVAAVEVTYDPRTGQQVPTGIDIGIGLGGRD